VAVACLAAATGCAAFDRALGKRWVQVSFRPGTAVPVMLRALSGCGHIPNVRPQAGADARRQARLTGTVRYRIDRASDGQVALLQTCLQRYPVTGMTISDAGTQ
jgi:hypothetical protein